MAGWSEVVDLAVARRPAGDLTGLELGDDRPGEGGRQPKEPVAFGQHGQQLLLQLRRKGQVPGDGEGGVVGVAVEVRAVVAQQRQDPAEGAEARRQLFGRRRVVEVLDVVDEGRDERPALGLLYEPEAPPTGDHDVEPAVGMAGSTSWSPVGGRSEEHTSE